MPNSQYDTRLSTQEEQAYQQWKQQVAPNDSGEDYDYRGAYKAKLNVSSNGHWPDTYKKPNHPTFSNESIYAKQAPEKAGHWEGETYVPNKSLKSQTTSMSKPYQLRNGQVIDLPGNAPAASAQAPQAQEKSFKDMSIGEQLEAARQMGVWAAKNVALPAAQNAAIGVLEQSTQPAKMISAGLHAAEPYMAQYQAPNGQANWSQGNDLIKNTLATPEQIQAYREQIGQIADQNGMLSQIPRMAGALATAGGQLAMGSKAMTAASGNLVPETLALFGPKMQASLKLGASNALVGGLQSTPGMGGDLWNEEGALFGTAIGLVAGPAQMALSKALAAGGKFAKTQMQNIVAKNTTPSGTINLQPMVQDAAEAGVAKSAELDILTKIYKTVSNPKLMALLEKASAPPPPTPPPPQGIVAKIAEGAGFSGAGGAAGYGLGYLASGGDHKTAREMAGWGTGIAAGIYATPTVISTLLKGGKVLNRFLGDPAGWSANTEIGKFFLNRLDNMGVIASVQGGVINLSHKDEQPKPKKPYTMRNGQTIELPSK